MKKNDINKQKELAAQKDEIEEKKRWIGYYEFTQRLVEPIQRLQEIKLKNRTVTKSSEQTKKLAMTTQNYEEWQK